MSTSEHTRRLIEQRMSRRGVLQAGIAAGLGLAGLGATACKGEKEIAVDAIATPAGSGGPVLGQFVPSNEDILATIEEIVAQGIRRPGSPADSWAEQFCLQRFNELGLENARCEPLDISCWETNSWSLSVRQEGGAAVDIPCLPLPYSTPVDGLECRLVAFDDDDPEAAAGSVALVDIALPQLPYSSVGEFSTAFYDPEDTFTGFQQTLPTVLGLEAAMAAIIPSGASAFIGAITGYPGDSCQYYVPYHARRTPIPAVWISGSSGERLRGMLATGPITARLTVDAAVRAGTGNNVVGELPGASDELVIVGSHHDGPWASAVEDASGTALVLAQAAYWSRVPREQRPHRMLFLLHAGHMAGGAGIWAFLPAHADEVSRTVLEVHLEHAALEFVEKDGKIEATGLPEPRWWFTSRIPQLETAVLDAIQSERLTRSVILPSNIFGNAPPTDGAGFCLAGVPQVSFLAAPFYLFDAIDTVDKIDRDNLAPISRAAIRIIESTRGETAQSMRAAFKS